MVRLVSSRVLEFSDTPPSCEVKLCVILDFSGVTLSRVVRPVGVQLARNLDHERQLGKKDQACGGLQCGRPASVHD